MFSVASISSPTALGLPPTTSQFLSVDGNDPWSRVFSSSLLLPSDVELSLTPVSARESVCWVCIFWSLNLRFDQFTKRWTSPFSFRSILRRSFLIFCTVSHMASSDTKGSLQTGHSYENYNKFTEKKMSLNSIIESCLFASFSNLLCCFSSPAKRISILGETYEGKISTWILNH